MKRPLTVAMLFCICAVVVFGALGWMTRVTLRAARAEADLRRTSQVEERVRLALWRMDSALGPIIAQENARPYFAYAAFYPAGRAYTRMYSQMKAGEVLLPSPLLAEDATWRLVHFQIGPDGKMTSPQVPEGNMIGAALAGATTKERISSAQSLLAQLQTGEMRTAVAGALSRQMPWPTGTIANADFTTDNRWASVPLFTQDASEVASTNRAAQSKQGSPSTQQRMERQVYQNEIEMQARGSNIGSQIASLSNTRISQTEQLTEGGPVEQGLMTAVWVGEKLLLVRKVTVGGDKYVQGCLLDWPGMRTWLSDAVRDLLPQADVVPVARGAPVNVSRLLASIPARIVPGPVDVENDGDLPVVMTLAAAWAGAVLAVAAAGALLWGSVSLSERRASFVSAVTHELRTPLTTFRMYTEMLEGSMAPEEKRAQYLATLSAEAARLSHLVENVLAYARLENSPGALSAEDVTLEGIIDRTRERLAVRASQSGMEIVEDIAEGDTRVKVDTSVVLQVLFNLVDNACKYASRGSDMRIAIVTARRGNKAAILVCDHGPGVSSEFRGKLFRPFSKSAGEAAASAPGVGLGLALSKRLARGMGGDLTLEDRDGAGACFVLTLPVSG